MTFSSKQSHAPEVELLAFRLGEQEYCVDIMSVREIRGWSKATPLPFAPDYVSGVINLRGAVLPVLDLAIRLGMDSASKTERSVIVVVSQNQKTVGLLVDAVSDIITLPSDQLHAPPDIASNPVTAHIKALIVDDERMLRVLDLNEILLARNMDAA